MDYLKIALLALFSAAVLFLLTKLMGHKQIAQLDTFDYINGITIGSIAAELATELEEPLKPLTALVVYALVALSMSIISNKLPSSRKIILGHPVVLMDNDKLYRKNFKKSKLDLNEFLALCRTQGYFDISKIETAVFEHNGSLSILPKASDKPLTPSDMKLNPQQDKAVTQIIMDGKLDEKNLKSTGKTTEWLKKNLRKQNIKEINDVFFAFINDSGTLTAYSIE